MSAGPDIFIELANAFLRDHDVRQRGQLCFFILKQEGGEFRFLVFGKGVVHAVVEVVGGVALADVVVCDAEAGDLDEAFDELCNKSVRYEEEIYKG